MSGTRFGFVLALGVGVVPVFGAVTVVDVPSGAVLTEADLLAGVFMGQGFSLDSSTEFAIKAGGRLAPLGSAVADEPGLSEAFDMGGAHVAVEQGGVLWSAGLDGLGGSAIADISITVSGGLVTDHLHLFGGSVLEAESGALVFPGLYLDEGSSLLATESFIGEGLTLAGSSTAELVDSDASGVTMGPESSLRVLGDSMVEVGATEGRITSGQEILFGVPTSEPAPVIRGVDGPLVISGDGWIVMNRGEVRGGIELRDRATFSDGLVVGERQRFVDGITFHDDATVRLYGGADGSIVGRGRANGEATLDVAGFDYGIGLERVDLVNTSLSLGVYDSAIEVEELSIAGSGYSSIIGSPDRDKPVVIDSLSLRSGDDDDARPHYLFLIGAEVGLQYGSGFEVEGAYFSAGTVTFRGPVALETPGPMAVTDGSFGRCEFLDGFRVQSGATAMLDSTSIAGPVEIDAGGSVTFRVRFALVDNVLVPPTDLLPVEITARDGSVLTLVFNGGSVRNIILNDVAGGPLDDRVDAGAEVLIEAFYSERCAADVNLDFTVGPADLAAVVAAFGSSVLNGPLGGDVDYSGSVNALDITTVLGQFGDDCR